MAMETDLFGWHWIWSASEKKRNTDRREAFQLARVTTAVPQERRMTVILLSEMTLTAQDDSINVFFNLDFYLQLTAGGNNRLVRRVEAERSKMKEKKREASETTLIIWFIRSLMSPVQVIELVQPDLCFLCNWKNAAVLHHKKCLPN